MSPIPHFRAAIGAFTLLSVACNGASTKKKDKVSDEVTPSSERSSAQTSSARPSSQSSSVAPDFAWARFPRVLTYTTNTGTIYGDAAKDPTREEVIEERTPSGERRITVNSRIDAEEGSLSITAQSVMVVNAEGMFTVSDEVTFAGAETKRHRFQPPKLTIPAKLENGHTWSAKRDDGVIDDMTLTLDTPYCVDGFRVTSRRVSDKGVKSRRSHHWCPGHGWRGEETFYNDPEGRHLWTWTTGLVADGVSYPDPSFEARLPEVASVPR